MFVVTTIACGHYMFLGTAIVRGHYVFYCACMPLLVYSKRLCTNLQRITQNLHIVLLKCCVHEDDIHHSIG